MGTRSSPFQRVQHQAKVSGFDAATTPNAIAARHIDLDPVKDRPRRCRNGLIRRDHHRQQLRGPHILRFLVAPAPRETRLVFTSYCRATTETDAPGADAAATISRFSSSDHTFRLTPLLVSMVALVDTSPTVPEKTTPIV